MTAEKRKKISKLLLIHFAIIFSVSLALTAVFLIFGTPCVFKAITGIDCPFCGMTRAHLSAAVGNFRAAFAFNPLFPLGLPFLLLIFHKSLLQKKHKRLTDFLVIAGIILFIIADIIRIAFAQ